MVLALRYAALSDVGRVRKDNQDSGYASEHLLVIADGVGGAVRGDLASSTAIQAMSRLDAPVEGDALEALAGGIHRAHDRIAELVEQDPELDGTSTTVTSALFDGTRIGVAHIGDSRGYLLRGGTLSQLTKDHTFVQSLIDEGRITEEESRTHPHRNLILRAVDGVHETDPDLFYVDLAPGDRILLCSDGASGVLGSDRLGDILGTGTIDYAVVELIRASLEAGSSDNITVVVADVVEATDGDRGRRPGRGWCGCGAAPSRRPHLARASSVGTAAATPARSSRSRVSPTRAAPIPRSCATHPASPGAGAGGAGSSCCSCCCSSRRRGLPRLPAGARSQYYVASYDGRVAIYRGVQADIPGLKMHRVADVSDVTIESLPDFPTEQVASGISAESLSDAHRIVSRLTSLAKVCPDPEAVPDRIEQPDAQASSKASARLGEAEEEVRRAPSAEEVTPPASGSKSTVRQGHQDAELLTDPDHRAAGLHRGDADERGRSSAASRTGAGAAPSCSCWC